jgi:hypothetical protein
MTDDIKKEEIAELKREVAELKAAVTPKPQPTRADQERANREWESEMHAMAEARANHVPPWLVRECAGGVTDADAADLVRASHRPQGPRGAIPSGGQSQVTSVHPHGGPLPSPTPGWRDAVPLSNPPGVNWVDAIAIADDVRQRAELARKLKP